MKNHECQPKRTYRITWRKCDFEFMLLQEFLWKSTSSIANAFARSLYCWVGDWVAGWAFWPRRERAYRTISFVFYFLIYWSLRHGMAAFILFHFDKATSKVKAQRRWTAQQTNSAQLNTEREKRQKTAKFEWPKMQIWPTNKFQSIFHLFNNWIFKVNKFIRFSPKSFELTGGKIQTFK